MSTEPINPRRVYQQLNGLPTEFWLSIAIEDHPNDIKKAFALSSIHVRREVEMTFCWTASEFTDQQILRDGHLIRVLLDLYGAPLTRCSCHSH